MLRVLLLPLLLLFAQQGALLHEIGHLGQRAATGSSSPGKQDRLADALCLSCLAHADLGGAAAADAHQPVLLSLADAAPQAPAVPWTPASAPQPRSRGPPSVL